LEKKKIVVQRRRGSLSLSLSLSSLSLMPETRKMETYKVET